MPTVLMESVTIGRDIILSCVAAITAGVAIFGLKDWRADTVWREERETAHDLIRGCIDLRRSFTDARMKGIAIGEFPDDPIYSALDSNTRKWSRLLYVYENRYKLVQEPLANLATTVIEVEVRWGLSLDQQVMSLFRCRRLLQRIFEIRLELNNPNDRPASGTQNYVDWTGELNKSISDLEGSLSEDLDQALDTIEASARSRLKRR